MVYGLGQFHYVVEDNGEKATYTFTDPEDSSNTQEVVIDHKDFPAGQDATARDVADMAYGQVADALNAKREARLEKAAKDADAKQLKADEEERKRVAQFHKDFTPVETPPVKIEKDGTRVYNTAGITLPPDDAEDAKPAKAPASDAKTDSDKSQK